MQTLIQIVLIDRTTESKIKFKIRSGSLTAYANPLLNLDINLEDMLHISIGPRDQYDGIKSCLTYNPIERSKPGYQQDRMVRPIR